MKRTFAILFVGLVGWGIYYHLMPAAKEAAIRERHETKYSRIAELKAAPAYKRLIERGGEICPGQPDQTIWVCGATIRMPTNGFPEPPSRRRCSSPEEPKYIGRFPLPEVTSAEPETEGIRVQVNIPRFGGRTNDGGGGIYNVTGYWKVHVDDLPEFVPCERQGRRECASLWISGESEIVSEDAYFYRAVPDIRESKRPAPEDIAYENHPLMDDAFLDLDGQPVAYTVGYPSSDDRYTCRFRVQHPIDGYILGLRIDCNQVDDWRELLRGIIAELSTRTIKVSRDARCDMPPPNARIAPQAHWTSLDQHQAMHDWAVEWDAHAR